RVRCSSAVSPRSGLLRGRGLVASEQESVSPPPLVDDDVLDARGLELAPQARGVRVDGASPDPGRADAPHVTEELRLREDTPRVARQLRSELELAPGEPHRRVADADLPGPVVDRERPRVDDVRLPEQGAAEERPHAGEELEVDATR